MKNNFQFFKNSNVAEIANFRAYSLQTNENESIKASQHSAITFLKEDSYTFHKLWE